MQCLPATFFREAGELNIMAPPTSESKLHPLTTNISRWLGRNRFHDPSAIPARPIVAID
jgi:hypothetical protein